jgi:hypothetical protein
MTSAESMVAMQNPMATQNKIDPPNLARIRERIKNLIPESAEAWDRRGFRLLEWQALENDPKPDDKPVQLSLEHEARLRPADDAAIGRLLVALFLSEMRPLRENVLPPDSEFGELILRTYVREPGPQSVDRYFDVEANLIDGLISRGITVRERLHTSSFMTWDAQGEMRALNLELPCVDVGPPDGMIARYEFNWIANLDATVRQTLDASDHVKRRNPLWLASQVSGTILQPLTPVIEHVTVRKKFAVHAPLDNKQAVSDGETLGAERYVINIDFVQATSVQDPSNIGRYVDVDISSVTRIDAKELKSLVDFASALGEKFNLVRGEHTKALRDAKTLGRLK